MLAQARRATNFIMPVACSIALIAERHGEKVKRNAVRKQVSTERIARTTFYNSAIASLAHYIEAVWLLRL